MRTFVGFGDAASKRWPVIGGILVARKFKL